MAICVCSPSVMGTAVPAVSAPVLMTCKLPHAVSGQPAGEVVVPATNKLAPLSRPTVAPRIGAPPTGVTTGVAGVAKFTFATLGAAEPAHSVPQNKMKAVVSFGSLGSKTAAQGWAPAGSPRTGA